MTQALLTKQGESCPPRGHVFKGSTNAEPNSCTLEKTWGCMPGCRQSSNRLENTSLPNFHPVVRAFPEVRPHSGQVWTLQLLKRRGCMQGIILTICVTLASPRTWRLDAFHVQVWNSLMIISQISATCSCIIMHYINRWCPARETCGRQVLCISSTAKKRSFEAAADCACKGTHSTKQKW